MWRIDPELVREMIVTPWDPVPGNPEEIGVPITIVPLGSEKKCRNTHILGTRGPSMGFNARQNRVDKEVVHVCLKIVDTERLVQIVVSTELSIPVDRTKNRVMQNENSPVDK